MKHIDLLPMQWGRLRDLREVEPLNDADAACLAELRDVLQRHGRLERFALQLAHAHFKLAAHEVLVEYSDPARRQQWLRVEPAKRARGAGVVATTWLLGSSAPRVVCVCAWGGAHGHLGRHESA
jgi:hypothetical protein